MAPVAPSLVQMLQLQRDTGAARFSSTSNRTAPQWQLPVQRVFGARPDWLGWLMRISWSWGASTLLFSSLRLPNVSCMSGLMRRTERLFALAEYLRGRRTGVTAEALAERFEVTVRTIYRDLDSLRAAALPLASERGRGGGYALDKNYSLPPVNFTSREAAVLVALGRCAIDMRLMPFADTLEAALDKVRSALSISAQRDLLARLKELSFSGVPALPSKKGVRGAVERAWFEQQPLFITYVDSSSVETRRRIRICGVHMERHETLLDAMDLESGERRPFRLDRITRAEVLGPTAP